MDIENLECNSQCSIRIASYSIAGWMGKDHNPWGPLERIFLNPEDALASDELWLCAWCYSCHKRCPKALKLPEMFLFIRAIVAERRYTRPLEKALNKIGENISCQISF